VIDAEQVLPALQERLTLEAEQGRRPGPDNPAALVDQLLHQIEQGCGGMGLEEGREGGEPPPGDDQGPVLNLAHLHRLPRGDVVRVAVLGHPGAEALIRTHKVEGVQHHHVNVAVLHVLHGVVLRARSRAKGGLQPTVSHGYLLGASPVGGIGERHLVDDARGAAEGEAVVVAVQPSALGVVIAGAGQELAPLEVVVAGG